MRASSSWIDLITAWSAPLLSGEVNRKLTGTGHGRGTGCLVRHATPHFRQGLQR